MCHPDGSPKSTGGSTAAGAATATAVSGGMTFYDGTPESEVTLKMAEILRDKLLLEGYDVLMIRDSSDVQLDNVARTVICNNVADCHISLHWDGDGLSYDKGCFYIAVPDAIKNMSPVADHWQQHDSLGASLVDGLRGQGAKIHGSATLWTYLGTGTYLYSVCAVDDNLKGYTAEKDGVYEMQAAATCIDNSTGNVVAIVGSRTQDLDGYTLNRAYQSYRQPGSSIKPVIDYVPYLEKGNTPDTIVQDEYIQDGPKNADGTYMGSITLRTAVSLSRNTVAWNVLKELTPKAGSSYLLNQGFHKVWMDKEYNAIAIGGFTYGVSTEEMAGAYATIANEGEYRRVTCVSQIKDTRGRIVYDSSGRGQKIYDAESCRMMTDMLETAVNEGTGRGAAPDNAIVAGKTGTTNSNYDSWFCGYSAYYTVAVWQGYDYPASIPQSHTKDIFRQFMQDSHKALAKKDFPKYRQKSDNKETETESVSETQTETQSVSETQSVTQTQKGSQIQSPSQMETGTARDNDATAGTRQDSTAGGSESRADTDKPAETRGDILGY